MAHNETRNGLNETGRVPRTWSRSTVADGQWMQKNTLSAYRSSDWFLAGAIDGLLDKDDELTQAIADEAAAREQNDSDLSAWCNRLVNSAEDLYDKLDDEVQARQDGDAATLRDAKAYSDAASAYVYGALSSTSGYLNGRIDGVSGTFDNFVTQYTEWQGGVNTDIGNLKTKTNQLSIDIKTSADAVRTEFATADENLQNQIDALTRASDVVDVVDTTASLSPYRGYITSGDIVKVLNGADGKQEYWQFAGAVTAQDPAFNKFTKIGELQPYYSISEIDSLFGNYYPKSELYTQTQVDTKLADKLDTSAEHIYQYLAVQIGQQPGKYVTVLNNMEILADRALRDYNGDTIHDTYVKQGALSTYATKDYVNGTFASANNVYAKNQTSGTAQLNTAFGNKLDTSAAFSAGYFVGGGAHGGGTFNPFSRMTMYGGDEAWDLAFTYASDGSVERGYLRKKNDITLHDNELYVWTATNMPDFEHSQGTYFII